MNSSNTKFILVVVHGMLLIPSVLGFPSGAPSQICTGINAFVPQHGSSPQISDAPYEITTSQRTYSAGDTITVTVQGKEGAEFRGFLIKARKGDTDLNQDALGSFTVITGTQKQCNNAALTHTNNNVKTKLELKWTAPNTVEGNIVFQATIVQVKATFWTMVTSDIITATNTGVTGLTNTSTTSTTAGSTPALNNDDVTVDLSECGTTISCFRNPTTCKGSDCIVAASWKRPTPESSYIEVKMIGKAGGIENPWLALGFSKDKKMGDDSVMACLQTSPSNLEVQNTFNSGKSNGKLTNPQLGISEAKISFLDGIIRCSFRRRIDVDSARVKRQTVTDNNKVFNLNESYYLLLGYGPTSSGNIQYHSAETPSISTEPIRVSEIVAITGSNDNLFYQLHGALMIAAWMFCVTNAVTIARYFKKAWPTSKLCGKDVWFPLHVCFNTTAVLCTIGGFVLIFLAVEGYSEFPSTAKNQSKAHPIIGITVMVLAILQPVIAICRCAPDHDKRPIFNFIHSFIGTSLITLAIVNIFFGMYLPKATNFTPTWAIYVLAAYTALYGLVTIIFEILKCVDRHKSKGNDAQDRYRVSEGQGNMGNGSGKGDVPMEQMGQFSSNSDTGGKGCQVEEHHLTFKYALLFIYIAAGLGMLVAMIVSLFI